MSELGEGRKLAGDGILQHECAAAAALVPPAHRQSRAATSAGSRACCCSSIATAFAAQAKCKTCSETALNRITCPVAAKATRKQFCASGMCDPSRRLTRDFRYLLKTYKDVFLGSTLVDWLTSEGV